MSRGGRRVAITGIGVVTPIGCTRDAFTAALLAGRSGVGPIRLFEPGSLPTRIAAEVREPIAGPYRDRKANFALAAAAAAVEDAGAQGMPLAESYASREGVLSLGIGLELLRMDDLLAYRRLGGRYPEGAEPSSFIQTPADLPVHDIARRFNLRMPPVAHVSACAASADAIGCAFDAIRWGRARWALAGGADSMVNPMGLAGFCRIGATTRRNDLGSAASRPFDAARDGFVLGEGAALLVLEDGDAARARGARRYGEILGFGNSLDAYGASEPDPEGTGAYEAMAAALADAGLSPEDIDYVNAHGTGTPKNDPIETLALRRLLGERAPRVPVSSTKSMLGHLIGAAGAVELTAALLAARAGYVHPTINLDVPDPLCDLDYVPGRARRWKVSRFLSNSFAFGGQNACLVVGVEANR